MKPAYYNEWDDYAAVWLRNLISRGLIAPGDVDQRSITDVRADDLRAALERVKQYVTADHIEVNRKMRPVEVMPMPNFIFCTDDAEPFKHLEGRRFHVAQMSAAG